jgi:hypothetical protein
MAGFQTQVYPNLAIGVAGDFADHNPRFSFMAGAGGLVSGAAGLTVGNFAWISSQFVDPEGAAAVVNNFGAGTPQGIVPRLWQGTNSTFLSPASMFVQPGYAVAIFSGGGFFVVNSGSGQALPGMNAYANLSTGAVTFASGTAAASSVTVATSAITQGTFSATGSIAGNVLTVTAVASGTIYNGATISGTNVASGSLVLAQLTSTASLGALGGTGTYAVSIPEQSVASTTISGTYGILTLGATPSGAFPTGALVTGTGITATTNVGQLIAGTAGVSGATYSVNPNTAVSSTTLTLTTNVVTNWIARSSGANGEIVKISNVPNT